MDQLSLFQSTEQPYSIQATLPTLTIREQPGYRVLHNSGACNGAELLAALLGGAQSIETAQRLLSTFGSLHSIARATCGELTSVQGVRTMAALRLKAALEISRRLLTPENERVQIHSPADAAGILQPLLMHRDQEHLCVLLLDTRNRVMGEPLEIYHGSLNTSLIRVGEVFRGAIRANAAAIVLSHNHPSGDPSPSPEDVAVTRAVVDAGKLLDIACLDHIVVGSQRFVSMKERGLGF